MANKQYTSIIRLFNFCGIATDEAYNSSRARKLLQAEFGIADNGFIEIEGFAYTRQDVFEEMERTDFNERLLFHRQIWESPQLLALLEENAVNVYTIADEIEQFRGDKAFDDFFSPFFAGPYQYVLRILLSEQRLAETGEWLKYEAFLQPAEREEALRPLRVYLDENERLLRNVKNENYKLMRPKIEHWLDTSWHRLFNNLPHEFYDIKTDIVILLINLTVAIQKKHRSDCRLLSDQLVALTDLEEEHRSVIVSNHTAYYSGSGSLNSGRSVWFVLWLVVFLIKIITCNNRSDSDNYRSIDNSSVWRLKDTVTAAGLRYSADTSALPKEERVKSVLDSILKKNP